jgi:hypothetical protein
LGALAVPVDHHVTTYVSALIVVLHLIKHTVNALVEDGDGLVVLKTNEKIDDGHFQG